MDDGADRGRTLAYLSQVEVDRVKGIGPSTAKKLADLGISSVADLLLHAPRRYLDRSQMFDLGGVPVGEEVTVGGEVISVRKRRISRNRTMIEATISDGSATLHAVWFNPYLRIEEGKEVALSGKVEIYRGRLQMKAPDLDTLGRDDSLVTGRVVPVHPAVAGLSARQLRASIANALNRSRPIIDVIPDGILSRMELVDRDAAIAGIHFPETSDQAVAARRRLVFDELFRLEVALALRRRQLVDEQEGIAHDLTGTLVARFLAALHFEPTSAQDEAFEDIGRDMASGHPMHRMLLADVGYGKTLVAMLALLTAVEGGYQGAFMAPTEILAVQHFLNLQDLVAEAGLAPSADQPDLFAAVPEPSERSITVALLTSNQAIGNFGGPTEPSRKEILELVGSGAIDIVVGTHALIQQGVEVPNLGLAVIDEQHRFGVHQRVQLREKAEGRQPDVLIMTATPIPRTLAMTLYGDLDVSTLDVAPVGRPHKTTTTVVGKQPADWEGVYRLIRGQAAKVVTLPEGSKRPRQTFVVCPLVEESDKLEAEAATSEYERLSAVLAPLRVGLIHGRMAPREKGEAMHAFREGRYDVLVATTVIEVGIDIPFSTVMVVEDADRFGLSQLHQLRGRLSRGEGPNYCVLMTEDPTEEAQERLAAMKATDDGFRIAEEDLRIRGQGTVFGTKQAGMTDLRLADILRDTDLLVAARRDAFAMVDQDPGLRAHPEIAEEVRLLLGEDVEWLTRS